MRYDDIIRRVALELGVPTILVDKTYKAYWRAIRDYLSAQPFQEELSDEEFLSLRPNVNVASLGKFHIGLDRYRSMKSQYELKKKENVTHKEDKTDVHLPDSDRRQV